MGKLYVIRHADAGTRGRGDGPDELRGLSTRGMRQAERLREQLADAGIERLVSSPYLRCVQTLEPLARLLDLPVELDDRLAEAQAVTGTLALADELRDVTAVICSHGDIVPDLLDALLLRGTKLLDEPRWPKASTWVLTRDNDGFSKGSYLPPPPA